MEQSLRVVNEVVPIAKVTPRSFFEQVYHFNDQEHRLSKLAHD